MSIWYANYSSRLDKRCQCCTSKVLMNDDCNQGKADYNGRSRCIRCNYRCACVRYYWCANKRVCALLAHLKHRISAWTQFSKFTLLSKLIYSECFITDARRRSVFWRSLWGSVVFMYIWVSDAPNILFWQRTWLLTDDIEPPSDRFRSLSLHTFRMVSFFICILVCLVILNRSVQWLYEVIWRLPVVFFGMAGWLVLIC